MELKIVLKDGSEYQYDINNASILCKENNSDNNNENVSMIKIFTRIQRGISSLDLFWEECGNFDIDILSYIDINGPCLNLSTHLQNIIDWNYSLTAEENYLTCTLAISVLKEEVNNG